MSAPLRLGLVGCGRIAERGYVPAALGVEGVEISALADPDAARAAELAGRIGDVACHGDLAEMLAAGGIDAVIVAAPAAAHLAAARLAAEAGLPCLVEKPPAPGLADARELTALRPSPAIGFNRRFLQGDALAPRLPARGWLELDLELCFRRGGWGAHVSRDEALLDAGTHLIDLACFLTGSDPIAVRGAAVDPERAELDLELARGRARLRCATDAGYRERVEARDSGGRVLARHALGGLRTRLARLGGAPDPLVASLGSQLAAFAATARRGGTGATAAAGEGTLAGAEDGARAMAVVEAAMRSAAAGGAEVTVEPLTQAFSR